VLSCVWAAMGLTEVLFTVAGHASGEYAMVGSFFLVAAAIGFAGTLYQRRRERSDSIR
jgi:malonyl CoA-acyl carrier protein transacylase